MTKLRAFLASVVLALLTVLAVAQPAAADDNAPITRYDATVNLTDDGVAEITVDFTMDFSQVRGRGPIIILPLRQEDGADPDWDYVFDYSNIRVDSPSGASAQVSTQYEGRLMSLRIGDENRWNTTPQDYTLSYSVTGFIVSDHSQSGMDEFNWDIIGPGWASRISNVTATVTGPAAVSQVACFYGPYTAQQPCEASSSGDTATFSHAETLPPKNPVQIVAGFPAGTFGGVEQRREKAQTLANAFELTPATGAATGAGLVAAVAGLVAIRRRHARDDVYLGLTPGIVPGAGEQATVGRQSGKFPVAVQFNPPKGASPGEIGTLMDTTADDVDVSATIVDLAVRGFLKIESTGKKHFTLYATQPRAGERLRPYEEKLLGNIFKGKSVRTSKELSKEKFQNVLPDARSGLYTAVVQLGWFKRNPTSSQAGPLVLGGLSLMAALGVAIVGAFAGWGLLAIPFAVFGIGLMAMSSKFRKRTAAGSAYLAQAKGFELYLRTAEKDTLKFEEG
ncbi:MAG TPA: DUF2207 domain-containing protein, partial [Arachnia sp.]|nr:DUF2207 domain-containing protein [Arachnia sp.]